MKRRDFLHQSLHAAAGAGLFNSMGLYGHASKGLNRLLPANPDNDHVLVIIFLNGGNDGLNSVVPLNQLSTLNQLRPHVFIPQNRLLPLNGTDLAFHPSMEGMRSLFQEDRLKVIRAVGYQDQNFSHFRSTDIWMSGSDVDEVFTSGWMGRYLDDDYPGYPSSYPTHYMPDPLAIEMGSGNSLLFQGPSNNMSVVLNGERDFYELVSDELDQVPSNLVGDKLAHIKLIRRQSQVYGEAVQNAAVKVNQQVSYPDSNLARQLRIVARLIAGGLKTPVYKVEIGGFDTHGGQVDQGNTSSGVHANLLRELSEAILAFMNDLEFLGIQDRVMGMTFSEFGRRIVSNGSFGTDHGSAGPVFLFGNALIPGIIGDHYELDTNMDFTDNLVHQYDFRQVYGSVLSQWLCVPQDRVRTALKNTYTEVPVVQAQACLTTSTNDIVSAPQWLKLYPNPVRDQLTIEFISRGGRIYIELLSASGQTIRNLVAKDIIEGTFKAQFDLSYLPNGPYFIQVFTQKERTRGKLMKIS